MSYITMPDIGAIGDIGSQIHQYFSLVALAKLNNKTLVFPKQARFIQNGLKFMDLLDIEINLMEDKDLKNFQVVSLDPNTTNLLSSSMVQLNSNINYALLNSRFDLYSSWYKNIKDIVDNTQYRPHILEYAKQFINGIRQDTPVISLHVRRGDYLLPQHNHFIQLGIDYYKEAIKSIDIPKFKLLIFSNDIEWCQINLNNIHNDIIYSINHSYQADMSIMSFCDHNIIANSSFSWWGAYLNKNPNKIVVCPNRYLHNHPLEELINNNYFPSDWRVINV